MTVVTQTLSCLAEHVSLEEINFKIVKLSRIILYGSYIRVVKLVRLSGIFRQT